MLFVACPFLSSNPRQKNMKKGPLVARLMKILLHFYLVFTTAITFNYVIKVGVLSTPVLFNYVMKVGVLCLHLCCSTT